MKTITRLLVVFTAFFTYQASAQVTTSFTGSIDSGQYETYAVGAFGIRGTQTLSLDLAGATYVIELSWSGSTEPDSTDNETVANWSGPL